MKTKTKTKNILSYLSMLLVVAFSVSFQAYNAQAMSHQLDQVNLQIQEGGHAPCVVLTGIEASGATNERCIREPLMESQKYTILKFFSVHCTDCTRLHKEFLQYFSDHSQLLNNTQINYIGIDRSQSELIRYAHNKSGELSSLGATVFLDSQRDAKKAYNVSSTPTVYILDNRRNVVLFRHQGPMSACDFRKMTSVLSN